MTLSAVILAAGKGTRMRSALPKVLHPVAGKAMVNHVVDAARNLATSSIYIVYGFGGDQLKQAVVGDDLIFVEQEKQLGTGHAVDMASPHVKDDDTVLVLYGDVPLTKVSTLQRLIDVKTANSIALLTVNLTDPTGYGRIVREQGQVVGIVEHKDASESQRAIKECNTGILLANGKDLKRWLSGLSNDNAQGEYYLTDIIAMAHKEGVAIHTAQPDSEIEVEGANNRVQLAALERAYQRREAEQLMIDGVTLLDPNRIDIRGKPTAGDEVVIDVNCIFEGNVNLGHGVSIGANCILKNCSIADNAVIKPNTLIEEATVGKHCTVGPFARLRPGAVMEDNSHVGNYVEMKKTTLGEGSKANHLTYLGDAVIGKFVNIGAGTITCNYDGVNKSVTQIGDYSFVGSNSSLVAPVTLGEYVTIGAGSTIAKSVENNDLAIGRAKQRNIQGWQRPSKKQ